MFFLLETLSISGMLCWTRCHIDLLESLGRFIPTAWQSHRLHYQKQALSGTHFDPVSGNWILDLHLPAEAHNKQPFQSGRD
ncbi:hypothetical protein F5Y15DRAFT_299529 [Xylariaceae sp. FL0016]|nr:hypothetical protein F5Y15DRAFT_299529 [Xylariaceae sp. FL0016]